MSEMHEIKASLARLEAAVCGDKFGNDGLVQRQKHLEKKFSDHLTLIETRKEETKWKKVGNWTLIGTAILGSSSLIELVKFLSTRA